MLNFRFALQNPWAKNTRKQKDYCYVDKKLSKNLAYSFQAARGDMLDYFNIHINISWQGEDHAGFELSCEFLGFWFISNLYDTRHWDYDNGKWEEYDE